MFRLSTVATPRWIIFLIDVIFCVVSIISAYLLRFNFKIPETEFQGFYIAIPYVAGVRMISFLFGKPYSGIVRFTSTKDAQRIVFTICAGTLFLGLFNFVSVQFQPSYLIPFGIVIIDFLSTTMLMVGSRVMFKILYLEYRNPTREKTNVIIYGAGEAGILTKRTLDRDVANKYNVVAFVDDDAKKSGKKLEGVKIVSSTKEFEDLLNNSSIGHVIIAIQNITPERKQEIINACLNHNVKVLNIPPINSWINGELTYKQIKRIKIEDLLTRSQILLDVGKIKNYISGKRVLVTGSAGSIGSELVRQIIGFNPGKVLLFDQAESPLYDMELEVLDKDHFRNAEFCIGDVRSKARLEEVFKSFLPEIVFHSAAYKHVPLMEHHPVEAVLTNVAGTKILADLSVQYGVEKFVMISTDKAVNPANIMGASKRIAEIYIQSLSKKSKVQFITTRFGNVLDSNGSVIPRFRKQIENGGPVTVTHQDITRFFMTIHEAAQLVLEAGAMGNGGEIFIFDMGESVKIVDLAKKMVQLSGLTLGKDIQLVFTGLRPGEKLYEELLNTNENTIPTHHPKILIAKVHEYDFDEVSENVDTLIQLCVSGSSNEVVKKMKQIIPEFISNNSIYEQMDD